MAAKMAKPTLGTCMELPAIVESEFSENVSTGTVFTWAAHDRRENTGMPQAAIISPPMRCLPSLWDLPSASTHTAKVSTLTSAGKLEPITATLTPKRKPRNTKIVSYRNNFRNPP